MKISGWGRYPRVESEVVRFETRRQLRTTLEEYQDCIVHACGRSYGDSALNKRVILTHRFDKIVHFDPDAGIITCESGVTIADIIETFLPRGWFLHSTPGTKYVSVGGAIASDVHGKNHHQAGCFSEYVIFFYLMLPTGEVIHCSREDNSEFFYATCGGMGLTGVILEVTLRLQRVKSAYICEKIIRCKNLEEAFYQFDENSSSTYSVAWIDCLAKGVSQGRSVLMLGEHDDSGRLSSIEKREFCMPFDSPSFFLNRHSISVFNHLYYHRHPLVADSRLVPINDFFYPLDRIRQWNRMYGPRGFTQYQFVLPKEAAKKGLQLILNRAANEGLGSFLAVLKLLGPENDNLLSFPMEGYTLALDFKIENKLFPVLEELDRIVLDCGGRVYLCKDVRMSKESFRRGYPGWKKFAELRQARAMDRKFNSLQSRRLGV